MADFRYRAVCKDEDPETFFPVGRSGPAELQVELAKEICRRCPVTFECLTWALESGQEFGVAGGMSEEERRALKRRRFVPSDVLPEPQVRMCRRSHPITGDNVFVDGRGYRVCRECHNLRGRKKAVAPC